MQILICPEIVFLRGALRISNENTNLRRELGDFVTQPHPFEYRKESQGASKRQKRVEKATASKADWESQSSILIGRIETCDFRLALGVASGRGLKRGDKNITKTITIQIIHM